MTTVGLPWAGQPCLIHCNTITAATSTIYQRVQAGGRVPRNAIWQIAPHILRCLETIIKLALWLGIEIIKAQGDDLEKAVTRS
jgi:hypothetical protein